MPKLKGIYRWGKGFYGAKWDKGKTYTTRIYPTAQETSDAFAVLVDNLQKGLQHNEENITVAELIDIFIEKYFLYTDDGAQEREDDTRYLRPTVYR